MISKADTISSPGLSSEEVMSLLFYDASRDDKPISGRSLAEKVLEARYRNLSGSRTIPLRPIPNGYGSDYISEYANLLVSAEMVRKDRGQIYLTNKGIRLLKQDARSIAEQKPKQTEEWMNFLGISFLKYRVFNLLNSMLGI